MAQFILLVCKKHSKPILNRIQNSTFWTLINRFDHLRYIHLPRAENQFSDVLATLASVIEIPEGVIVRPLLIETRYAPAYYFLIKDIED